MEEESKLIWKEGGEKRNSKYSIEKKKESELEEKEEEDDQKKKI